MTVRPALTRRQHRQLRPPTPLARVLEVPPERAAIAFTADRGWHMVQAPPAWLLDILAEVD